VSGIGSITDEAALRAFVQRVIDGGQSVANIRQLQGASAELAGRVVTADAPRGLRCGTASVTFVASDVSAVTAVSHGLDVVPASVQLTGIANDLTLWVAAGATDSVFSVQGRYRSGLSGTFQFYWLAVG
jgi:hypothetical protein